MDNKNMTVLNKMELETAAGGRKVNQKLLMCSCKEKLKLENTAEPLLALKVMYEC